MARLEHVVGRVPKFYKRYRNFDDILDEAANPTPYSVDNLCIGGSEFSIHPGYVMEKDYEDKSL